MAIIRAPDYHEVSGQLVFLAGPIQGAEDWQAKAIEFLTRGNPALNIASPRGDYSKRAFDYNTQVDWETHYLNLAAKTGAILFWLAKEQEHMCDRAFAQTTRFELAKWIERSLFVKELKLSIGIEAGFSGERYIRRVLGQEHPSIVVYSSLEDVCRDALQKL